MSKHKQSYRYRPQNENISLPWYREYGKKLERWNKILTLRLIGKILRIKPVFSPIPIETISSVLIIRYDALGDMIVTTPLWRLLKHAKPSLRIGVAGSFKNLDLLRADPDIDNLYDYSASSLREFAALSKKTREVTWDVVLMCNFNQKTRNSIISRLASRKGITATVGAPNLEGHQALFSRLVTLPDDDSAPTMTEQLQYFLHEVIAFRHDGYERPSIVVDPDVERRTIVRITEALTDESRSKYIVLNVDAPAFKRWGLENNMKLAEHISDHYPDLVVFITSLPNYQGKIESYLSIHTIERVKYFPTEDIHAMVSLIRHSILVITPDTSIVHLASAENKPVVSFYLAAREWLPYEIPAYIVVPKKGDTIASIPFQTVADGVKTMLGDNPPRGGERIIVELS